METLHPTARRIRPGEVGSYELRTLAQIDDAAVGIEAAADVRAPAIAEVDPSGERSTMPRVGSRYISLPELASQTTIPE